MKTCKPTFLFIFFQAKNCNVFGKLKLGLQLITCEHAKFNEETKLRRAHPKPSMPGVKM